MNNAKSSPSITQLADVALALDARPCAHAGALGLKPPDDLDGLEGMEDYLHRVRFLQLVDTLPSLYELKSAGKLPPEIGKWTDSQIPTSNMDKYKDTKNSNPKLDKISFHKLLSNGQTKNLLFALETWLCHNIVLNLVPSLRGGCLISLQKSQKRPVKSPV